MLRRLVCGASVAAAMLALGAQSVFACGGLVARNGAVRLDRATTFVAWHGGVEHYLTSFSYQGVASDVGWIVPLPAVPTSIEPGGRWTLQRLVREFSPPVEAAQAAGGLTASAQSRDAQVLQQTTVDAVDLTVLKGSAAEVLQWCKDNDFAINGETRAHIEDYAASSPIFMAAKYDVQKANAEGRFQGDGTPVLITMPTAHLWVPLEVLANAFDPVDADLFLLTDTPTSSGEEQSLFGIPTSSVGDELPGAPGFVLEAQRPMSAQLHSDLASDRNMSWVPSSGWVTHLTLHAQSPSVDYDMNVSSRGDIRLVSFAQPANATTPEASGYTPQPHITAPSLAALIAVVAVPLAAVAAVIVLRRRRGAA
jgi:Uncharacterized protein conserved in bacteria (DUF2330)